MQSGTDSKGTISHGAQPLFVRRFHIKTHAVIDDLQQHTGAWRAHRLRPNAQAVSPGVLQYVGERFEPVSYTHLTLPTIYSV